MRIIAMMLLLMASVVWAGGDDERTKARDAINKAIPNTELEQAKVRDAINKSITKEPKIKLPLPNAATIVVTVPEDAMVQIDGEIIKATGPRRIFFTPSLPNDNFYTVQVLAQRKNTVQIETVYVRRRQTVELEMFAPKK